MVTRRRRAHHLSGRTHAGCRCAGLQCGGGRPGCASRRQVLRREPQTRCADILVTWHNRAIWAPNCSRRPHQRWAWHLWHRHLQLRGDWGDRAGRLGAVLGPDAVGRLQHRLPLGVEEGRFSGNCICQSKAWRSYLAQRRVVRSGAAGACKTHTTFSGQLHPCFLPRLPIPPGVVIKELPEATPVPSGATSWKKDVMVAIPGSSKSCCSSSSRRRSSSSSSRSSSSSSSSSCCSCCCCCLGSCV